jgi:hypothetical protein
MREVLHRYFESDSRYLGSRQLGERETSRHSEKRTSAAKAVNA